MDEVYGKIFTREEADNNFGKVIESIDINREVLNNYLNNTENVIMFKIENKELLILGDKRKVLKGNQDEISEDLIFHIFSVNIVEDLLKLGKDTELKVEMRSEVLTITNENYTLELSIPCPPNC